MSTIGRPRERNREQLLIEFALYVEETPIPIVAEFAAQQGFGKSYLYGCPEFAELLTLCTTKKEAALERLCLTGAPKSATTMAIFSLKQLGWKDRIEHSGDRDAPVALNLTGSDVRG